MTREYKIKHLFIAIPIRAVLLNKISEATNSPSVWVGNRERPAMKTGIPTTLAKYAANCNGVKNPPTTS